MGSDQNLTVGVESRAGIVRIALCGELDMETVPYLEAHLKPWQSDGVSVIMLDLRELTYLDSSGLHAFVQARERADANGQRLVLIGARPSAHRIFEITDKEYLLGDQDDISVIIQLTRGSNGQPRKIPELHLEPR